MRNGVFFRLGLSLPKKAVAAWKKAKLRDQRERIPEEHAERGGDAILGGELSVQAAKTLKAALETLNEMGLEVSKSDVAHWEKTVIDGEPHIRIETKGGVKRDASVKQLLDYLKKRTNAGEEFVLIESDGKDGMVELRGYLGGYDAYSDHFLPFVMLGAAAAAGGGEGELVFLADVELRDESVFVLAGFSKDGEVNVEVEDEPQDITDERAKELEAALGDGGYERIQKEHAAWLAKFVEKKRRRIYAGRVGWLRPDGSFAIEPRYRSAGHFEEGLAAVAKDGPFDYGYIDEKGELLIEHRFFSAGGFKKGRALVQVELSREELSEYSSRVLRAYGYVDPKGELVISPRWQHAEDFSEERAAVGESVDGENRRGYIDPTGRLILPVKYGLAKPFSDGLGLIAEHDEYETGGYGFIDKEGQVVIPLSLQCAGVFKDGVAPACRNDLWGFIDRTGKWLVEPRFQETDYIVNDRALARPEEKWGVIDGKGKTIIEFEHDLIARVDDWFVSIGEGESTCFDLEGKKLFHVPYDSIGDPRDGKIRIGNGYSGPYGYMDFGGRILCKPRFRFAAQFSDGLAIVEDEKGKWGIIDDSFAMKIAFDFKLYPSAGASHFAKNGLAYIESGSHFGLVNREGRVLHPPELEALFGFGEELIYARYPEDLD